MAFPLATCCEYGVFRRTTDYVGSGAHMARSSPQDRVRSEHWSAVRISRIKRHSRPRRWHPFLVFDGDLILRGKDQQPYRSAEGVTFGFLSPPWPERRHCFGQWMQPAQRKILSPEQQINLRIILVSCNRVLLVTHENANKKIQLADLLTDTGRKSKGLLETWILQLAHEAGIFGKTAIRRQVILR